LAPQSQVPPQLGQPTNSFGTAVGYQAAPALAQTQPQAAAPPRRVQPGASYVTGAYQASGDPAIDRMIRLEAACKRFGSPL